MRAGTESGLCHTSSGSLHCWQTRLIVNGKRKTRNRDLPNACVSHQLAMEPPPSQETASLVKRLAGPSTGKAGCVLMLSPTHLFIVSSSLAKDQAEINRVIADVSKGSKFYEARKVCQPHKHPFDQSR